MLRGQNTLRYDMDLSCTIDFESDTSGKTKPSQIGPLPPDRLDFISIPLSSHPIKLNVKV